MALIIPDGFGQATLLFDFITGPSNPMAMVFGYSNGNDQSPLQNAIIVRDEYESNVLVGGGISNNVRLVSVDVQQNPGLGSASAPSVVTGDNQQQAMPPQVSFLIHKETAIGGRAHRGRFYQPGPTVQGVTEGGLIDPATFVALNVSFTGWRTNLNSNSIPMVILHSSAVLAPTPVEFVSCDSVVATQRRRLRG